VLAGTWDGEKRPPTKHADNLLQLPNRVRVPPSGWKCEQCEKTDNLWLNLTDGSILCGRKFFDGTGGNNHAVAHYQETKHPLAVKLGTITPNGADVYSYDEDDMVEDHNLDKHLAHFGINVSQMEKTDKSMIELEIDLNQRIGEWATIQEAGFQLKPVFGPGYTGLANLGNSCYLNSVMQVIFSIPAFQARYYEPAQRIFSDTNVDPSGDFTVQMSKLACGLLSGEYSKPASNGDGQAEQVGIRPTTFKLLVGRGHPEFSTKRQQDARDFFLHLVTLLERNSRHQSNPAECFKFKMEDRTQCVESRKVKYVHSTEHVFSLPIPLDLASNKEQVLQYETKRAELEARGEKSDIEVIRPRIALSACIETWAAQRAVADFYSPELKRSTTASKTLRLSTFPDYLMIQLEKYTIGEGWVPKKLDVSIDVPDELDLSYLRGSGLQPGEELMSEESSVQVDLNSEVVMQLAEMGFPVEACRKAVFNTNNSGLEAATGWIMEHMGDPDFGDPFVPNVSGSARSAANFVPSEDGVVAIMGMGFTRDQATRALKATDNNLERAADWIFSHINELDSAPMDTSPPEATFTDGPAKYKLQAFVSHMGTSTMVGHYVCHILKDGRWIIYNDHKVALSENPPKDLGYLYLYRRIN
jgi:ubiquitin carboxyl-terminal hydrolase 5/13